VFGSAAQYLVVFRFSDALGLEDDLAHLAPRLDFGSPTPALRRQDFKRRARLRPSTFVVKAACCGRKWGRQTDLNEGPERRRPPRTSQSQRGSTTATLNVSDYLRIDLRRLGKDPSCERDVDYQDNWTGAD